VEIFPEAAGLDVQGPSGTETSCQAPPQGVSEGTACTLPEPVAADQRTASGRIANFRLAMAAVSGILT
jgi:hypothetical protein